MQAADVLRLTQLKISALLRRRLDGFSMDRLVRFLNALDQDVNITVRNKKKHVQRFMWPDLIGASPL
jgi:predicted XRE-type DNA-binding protein